MIIYQGRTQRGGFRSAAPPPNFSKPKFKKLGLCRYGDIKSFHDFPFNVNQPLKSADDKFSRILKNKLIKFKKRFYTVVSS